MDGTPPTATVEALLLHRAWLRRVARALAGDGSRADDLEQEVWLRALRSPPARPSRGWLGTVLRNAAANLRRGEGRRRSHEARSEPGTAPPGPEGDAIRAEAVDRLSLALAGLEEPYRTTVHLRYFEDLALADIASRTGVPRETVRTRLRRALERLRERMDAGNDGERRAWVALLLPFAFDGARPPRGSAGRVATATVLEGVLVTGKAKAAIAAALLLLLLVATWRSPAPTDSGGRAGETASTGVGDAIVGRAPSAAPAEPPTVAAPTLLVLDPDGRPAPGARVSYLSFAAGGGTAPLRNFGITDADGRAAWPAETLPFPGLVRAEHGEFAPADVAVTGAVDGLVLRLTRGFTLPGRVVRRADGSSVAGATLTLHYNRFAGPLGPLLGSSGSFTVVTRSGDDGRFILRGMAPAATCLIEVSAAGLATMTRRWSPGTDGPSLLLEMDPPVDLVIHLRDGLGRPLPGGRVALAMGPRTGLWSEDGSAVAMRLLEDRGDGSYVAGGLPPDWYLVAAGHAGWRPHIGTWVGARSGTPPTVIALQPASGLEGRVVDAATMRPVPGARLRLVALMERERGGNFSPTVSLALANALDATVEVLADAEGRFALPCVEPGIDDLLQVLADGYGRPGGPALTATVGELGPGPFVDIAIPRTPRVAVRGRVVEVDGAPVAGAVIRTGDGVSSSAGDGTFRLENVAPGDLPAVMAPGRFPTVAGPVEEGGGDLGDIVLVRCATVEGRVEDADGRPVPGLPLTIEAVPPPDLPASVRRPAAAASDGEGVVRFEALPGHEHRIAPWRSSGWSGEARVVAGSGDRFILSLVEVPPEGTATVDGTVLMPGDSPPDFRSAVGAWRIVAGEEDRPVASAMVEPDGAFRFRMLPAGIYRIRFGGGAEWRGSVEDLTVVDGGRHEIVLRVEPVPPEELPKTVPRVDVHLRPEPMRTPREMRALMGWVTPASGARSTSLRVEDDGLHSLVRSDETRTAWLVDSVSGEAGFASVDMSGTGNGTPVTLFPSGRVLLRPGSGGKERWIELRTTGGACVYSSLETGLPGVAGQGHHLDLPEGTYDLTLSLGIARREPVRRSVTVRRGETVEVD